MTRWTLSLFALSAGLALGQPAPKPDPAPKEPPKPAAGSLEDTLDKALRNSADIKVAEAKVRDTEAELNRVRQQVLMRATALHNELRLAKRMLEVVETARARLEEAAKRGFPEPAGLDAGRMAVEKQKAEIEKLEAELKAVRGEFAIHRSVSSVAFSPDGKLLADWNEGRVRLWDTVTGKALSEADGKPVWDFARSGVKSSVQSTMAERVQKWLDQEVESKLTQENELRLQDLFEVLRKTYGLGVPVRMMNNTEDFLYRDNLSGQIQLGALLQAVEDGGEKNLAIVVRDYGLLVTTKDRVPEGAVRALDLWKANDGKKPEPAKK